MAVDISVKSGLWGILKEKLEISHCRDVDSAAPTYLFLLSCDKKYSLLDLLPLM